jgi:DNA-binding PadR family transcriptional regulator
MIMIERLACLQFLNGPLSRTGGKLLAFFHIIGYYIARQHVVTRHIKHIPMIQPTETPLTESTYFILLSLSPKPKHGYAIMKDVQELSENRVVLSTGTLYGALKRLLDQGWIVRMEDANKGTVRDRKVYKLSEHGRRALRDEIARLNKLLNAANQRVAREHI